MILINPWLNLVAFNDTCFVTMGSSDAPRNATTDEVPYVNVHPPLLNIWVAVGIPVGAIGALVIGTIAVVVWKCRSQSTRNRTRHDRGKQCPSLLRKDEVLLYLLQNRVDCTMRVDHKHTKNGVDNLTT